ncbi:MAG: precorrin-4 C(11)-methyltransferase [Clostridia bacterium]|nr:precorrin-4 C(11)-methyltransferase [Clostridia bacterium]
MVHFVGAGSGAVDLITVRGQCLLQEADQVIYAGSLVNPELLAQTKPDCKILNSASMTLEEVIYAMQETEASGGVTVRLHTGDPSIYGAIREQMDRLDALQIQYDVTPGVSSFCASAAAIPAEFTLPGQSQTVIITRMPGRTPVPEKENMRSLAAHRASMAIFLSTGLLKDLSRELIEGGYPEDTPAAIVYKASWPEQKVLRCTVSNLEETAERNAITKTAMILVGSFLGADYERSLLYDPSFSHMFRKGSDAQ